MHPLTLTLTLTLLLTSCGVKKYSSDSFPVSHAIWNELLSKYVDDKGSVDYEGFLQDSLQMQEYLQLLSSHHPNEKNWTEEERLAYWLNAYNAFTVKLIMDYYPVEGIKEIKGGIPFVNTIWDVKFINIEGQTYDLNNIEHGIIRDRFEEPRIHFAANCASVSCPNLRDEAYIGEKLEAQLQDQALAFLSDKSKNIITPDNLQLSRIFSWYKGDFTKNGSLIDFLNQYAGVVIEDDAEVDFLEYDWRLNVRENMETAPGD